MKNNFEENIKIDQGNKINSYFLIQPPSTPTIRLNPPATRLHEVRTVSPEIPFQQVPSPRPRAPTPRWPEEQVLLSRILQMAKSKGFKSGEEGGHNSFGQNPAIFLLHHSWTRFAVWDVAPSSWRVIASSSNAAFTQGTNPFRYNSRHMRWLTPNPSMKKRRPSFLPKPSRPSPRQKPASVLETRACRSTGSPIHLLHAHSHPDDCARPGQWTTSHQSTELEVTCHLQTATRDSNWAFVFPQRDRLKSPLSIFGVAPQLTPAAEANFPTLLGFLPTFSPAFSMSFGAPILRPTLGRAEPVSFKCFRALETQDLPTQPLNSVDTLPGSAPTQTTPKQSQLRFPWQHQYL